MPDTTELMYKKRINNMALNLLRHSLYQNQHTSIPYVDTMKQNILLKQQNADLLKNNLELQAKLLNKHYSELEAKEEKNELLKEIDKLKEELQSLKQGAYYTNYQSNALKQMLKHNILNILQHDFFESKEQIYPYLMECLNILQSGYADSFQLAQRSEITYSFKHQEAVSGNPLLISNYLYSQAQNSKVTQKFSPLNL